MSANPYFSIIMPTYNRAWALPQTLKRIVDQTFKDWELLIVDDGSTDNTRAVVEAAQKQDSRIHYLYQDNARQAAARAHGLTQAHGTWVTYIDSDDEPYPDYLAAAQEFFTAHPQVWYAMAFMDRSLELHDTNNQVLATLNQPATELDPGSITLQHYAHWKIKPCGTGIFHRRDKARDGIAWDTSFRLFEDIDFMFQFRVKYPANFGFIARPLFRQRQIYGTDGVCSNASYEDWANGFEKLYKKYEGTWLMEGQEWYPKKVNDYRAKQKLAIEGKLEPAYKRYFSEYFRAKNRDSKKVTE